MMQAKSKRNKDLRVINSAGGLVVNKGRVCLAWQPMRSNWSLPKGSIEKGETPRRAAAREVLEETGVRGEPLQDLGILEREGLKESGPVWKRISMFLFRTDEEELNPTETKHVAKWFSFDDAIATDPYTEERDFLTKHKKLISNE